MKTPFCFMGYLFALIVMSVGNHLDRNPSENGGGGRSIRPSWQVSLPRRRIRSAENHQPLTIDQPNNTLEQINKQWNHVDFHSRPLYIEVYKSFRDAVIMDWFISLTEKDRLKVCEAVYWKQMPNQLRKSRHNDSKLLSPFMPISRTFVIENLDANQSYAFRMNCTDLSGHPFSTPTLTLATKCEGTPSLKEYQSALDSKFNDSQGELKFVLLPAISASSVLHHQPDSNPNKVSSWDGLSGAAIFNIPLRKASQVSPHYILGASCAVVGFIIVSITVGLALRRYSQYRQSGTRLWELQTVQELEECVPSFIACPPPYSEEPMSSWLPPPTYTSNQTHQNPHSHLLLLPQHSLHSPLLYAHSFCHLHQQMMLDDLHPPNDHQLEAIT